jgi:lipid-binding SYLF domain-containing protein
MEGDLGTEKLAPLVALTILLVCAWTGEVRPAAAATKGEIATEVGATLEKLYTQAPESRQLANKAKGMLVFPSVKKGGLIVGGSYGEGALLINDKPVAYYSTTSGSIGLQAGYQESSVVYMFMTDEALQKFRESSGWEVGGDASVAVIDTGSTSKIGSQTFDQPVVAFVFGESGLMAGVSLEGSKISRLEE